MLVVRELVKTALSRGSRKELVLGWLPPTLAHSYKP